MCVILCSNSFFVHIWFYSTSIYVGITNIRRLCMKIVAMYTHQGSCQGAGNEAPEEDFRGEGRGNQISKILQGLNFFSLEKSSSSCPALVVRNSNDVPAYAHTHILFSYLNETISLLILCPLLKEMENRAIYYAIIGRE